MFFQTYILLCVLACLWSKVLEPLLLSTIIERVIHCKGLTGFSLFFC